MFLALFLFPRRAYSAMIFRRSVANGLQCVSEYRP
jgi:hypothetical protein